MKTTYIYLIILLAVGFSSCEKFIQLDPPTNSLVRETVFQEDKTANAAVTAIYHMMQQGGAFACGDYSSVTSLCAQSADELVYHGTSDTRLSFYNNAITSDNSNSAGLWSSAYQIIYMANAVLNGLDASTTLTPEVKTQLEGEARFIRAFCNFYLVNLYGDVPLVTSIDYRINSVITRTPSAEVYQLIVEDLKQAQLLLADTYSVSSGKRTRPNKAAASALLARVYLFQEDWANAEIQATNVLDNSLYSLLPDLNQVFLPNSSEAIWQLFPVDPYLNTWEAYYFIMTDDPTSLYTTAQNSLTDQLLSDFEEGDLRKVNWVGVFEQGTTSYSFPYKYKELYGDGSDTPAEYSMVIRLAEVFLIRAEARAHQGKLTDAIADLDAIRQRAGLPLVQITHPGISQADLLLAVEHERRIELFTEWGHRWLDLKRTGRATAVLAPVKGANWNATDELYPIAEQEILNDPNLTQNPGY